jgi:tetratricopeptide (TPR) repeat protein
MSTSPDRRSTLPFIIGGLCVVLVILVWQVIPRQPAGIAVEEIPTTLEEAIAVDPVAAAVEKVRGENPMAGILELKALAEANPPNVDAVIELGRFSIQSGQLDKAKERFVQAIDLAPERAEPLVQLGMLELDGGNPAEALIHFERAVLVDSTSHNAWFFQAQCHERLGNPGLALAGYQRFLPLSPDTIIEQAVRQRIDLLTQSNS